MHTRLLSCSLIAIVLTTAASLPARGFSDASTERDDALIIHSGGLDRILVDDRDKQLRDALGMLGDRLAELPAETGQDDMPGQLMKTIADMLMSPLTLRAGFLEDADPEAGPPFYAQLLSGANDFAEAETRASAIAEFVTQMGEVSRGKPVREHAGILRHDADGADMYIGHSEVAGKPVVVVGLNELSLEATSLSGYGLPRGVRPVFTMQFDSTKVGPFIEMMMENAGPQADIMRGQLAMLGLLGDQPLSMTLAFGHGDDRSHFAARYSNYALAPLYGSIISTSTVGREELSMIPIDATVAQIGKAKINGIGDYFRSVFGAALQGEDPFAMIAERIGINPETDLLAHLGETWGYYLSDTTGGGGLLSAVGFVEVKDLPALRDTLDELTTMANDLAAQNANEYIQFRHRTIRGQEMVTLSFPGLPVPVEISYAVHAGHLFVAATPQALTAALDHIDHGERSLANNPRFREMSPASLSKAMNVTWMDTPRLLRSGYGLMSMAASAISNGVRSPRNLERDPGLVMPPFRELAKDAKASVVVSWMEEDDLVVAGAMDRCALVNMTGAAGVIGPSYAGIGVAALGTGIMLPALAKARHSAQGVKSMAQIQQMQAAIELYRIQTNAAPASLMDLAEQGFIAPSGILVTSPFGPVFDDAGDYWLDTSVKRPDDVADPAERIHIYDRAMLLNQSVVAVGFYDGHTELVPIDRFFEIVEEERHQGLDFKLPW